MFRLVLIAIMLLLAGCGKDNGAIASLGTLEVDRISLVADSAEPIVEVSVTEGDFVEAGDVLLRQDPARINATLRKAEADLAGARARLQQAEAGPRAQDIDGARAQVAAAESDVKTARLELEREKSLVTQNYASQNTVDILAGRYDAARARKQEADSRLAELLEGTRPEEIDAARSNLAMAQAQVEDVRISLERTTLVAPVKGKVEAVIHEVGERPQPGAVVMVLARDQRPYARVHVPEPLRTQLSPGADAEIHIDGHDKVFPGRLRWIAHDASFTPFFALTQRDRSHLSYLAEIELTGDNLGDLATGVPVQVYFPGVK